MAKMSKVVLAAVVVLAVALLTSAHSACAADSVALSPHSGTPGTAVTVSGSAGEDTWVALKVLDQTGSIVFFDTVVPDETGAYSCTFIAPDLPPGPLTVIAGQGTAVSQAVFTLRAGSSAGSNRTGELPRTANTLRRFFLTGMVLILTGALFILGKQGGQKSGM